MRSAAPGKERRAYHSLMEATMKKRFLTVLAEAPDVYPPAPEPHKEADLGHILDLARFCKKKGTPLRPEFLELLNRCQAA